MNFDDFKGLVISVALMILIYLWQQGWSKLKSRFTQNKPQEQPREKVFTPLTMSVKAPEVEAPARPFENPEAEGVSAVEKPQSVVVENDVTDRERRRRRRLAQTIVAGEILRPRFRTFDEF